ncbi:MAG: hypothetical protein ACK5PZ_13900, partial [Pirellula sp.]
VDRMSEKIVGRSGVFIRAVKSDERKVRAKIEDAKANGFVYVSLTKLKPTKLTGCCSHRSGSGLTG